MHEKTIVFGGKGQLGSAIQSEVSRLGLSDHFIFADRSSGDITNLETLSELFENHQPTFVVNCAAYTAVDQAESEEELATSINATGAKNVAQLCTTYQAKLIHISTDFVFGKNGGKALVEEDTCAPESVYGQTKLEGEKAIQNVLSEHFILRTSWLYSEYGKNFFKTMLRLAESRSEISVVGDQIGTPTYARDLAKVVLELIKRNSTSYGTFHYSNEGAASWYDFARAIFELSKVDIKVNYIRSEDYPTPAKRPNFSLLEKHKIKESFNLAIPNWRDSLAKCIANFKS